MADSSPPIELWSDDKKFGIRIGDNNIRGLIRECKKAAPNETGGILIGHYNDKRDCALVTTATAAPSDSKSGRTWFERGIKGLQSWLDGLWRLKAGYYLGEWHFHPCGNPVPSSDDIRQMEKISRSPLYHCPEPVLVIIGGEFASNDDWKLAAFVTTRGQGTLFLHNKLIT